MASRGRTATLRATTATDSAGFTTEREIS